MRLAKLSEFRPDPRNANEGTERGRGMLETSVRRNRLGRSVLADKHGVLIAGNKTHEVAIDVGVEDAIVVPTDGTKLIVVQRTDLDLQRDPAAAELALADNRVAEVGLSWDASVIDQLKGSGVSLDALWSDAELAEMFGGPADGTPGKTDPDAVPEPRRTSIVAGQVFALGAHRLICGDATDGGAVDRLLAGDHIDAVVSSPPYNVGIKYRSHKDKATREAYLAFIEAAVRAFVVHMAKGRFVAWNLGVSPKTFPAHQVVTLEACGLSFYRQIVWAKSGVPYPVFPSTLRTKRVRHYAPNYTHEVIQVFETADDGRVRTIACTLCDGTGKMAIREMPMEEGHGTLQLLTNGEKVELGGDSVPDRRYQNDVWSIAQSQATVGLKTIGQKSSTLRHGGKSGHTLKEHPAPFPVELPRAVLSFVSGAGEVVYDPFGGSGSTLIACEQLDRQARLVELDPVYCQIVVDRWEAFTGRKVKKLGEVKTA